MKNKTIYLAIMMLPIAAFAQITISDDWNASPVGPDGLDGWAHNLIIESNWNRAPQGDVGTQVEWMSEGSNGFLQGIERAGGREDKFVAPDKFITIAGGNFGSLSSAVVTFKYRRILPASTTSPLGVQVVLTRGQYTSVFTLQPDSGLPTDFYTTAGTWVDCTVDLLNPEGWVVTASSPELPPVDHSFVLGSVDGMLMDIDIVSGAETNQIDDVVLTYDDGNGSQTVESHFDDAPAVTDDGRAGWTRNSSTDGFLPNPQGDVLSRVKWGNQGLAVFEAGQGANDYFVAPPRYIVNNGRFNGLSSGSFSFDFTRFDPTTVTTANRGTHIIRLYSGSAFVQYSFAVASFVDGFFDVDGITQHIDTPDINSPHWTVSSGADKTTVLSNITAILIDGEVVNGRELNILDNFSFTYTLKSKITGTVEFQSRVARQPQTMLVEFINPSTGIVEFTDIASVDASGNYECYQPTNGTYDLAFKTGTFLRKIVGGVQLPGNSDVSGVNLSLINGDVDGDNEVAPNDFSVLSGAFGTVVGDAGYVDGADLDGDEEVGPNDFSILASNFGLSGD